jgi:plasmid replication initiation protein
MEKIKDRKFLQSNYLIQSRYNLSAVEKNLWFVLVSRIDNRDKDWKDYTFNAKDLAEKIRLGNTNTTYLKGVTKSVLAKPVEITAKDGTVFQCNIISSAKYTPDNLSVTLRFDPILKPYLLELKNCYTIFNLEVVLGLKSIYSKRIYELIKQWEKIGTIRKTIEELREWLMIPPSRYKNYNDFKKSVLIHSMDEINEHADIPFDFVEDKGLSGKKVKAIIFRIGDWDKRLKVRAEIRNELKATVKNKNNAVIDDVNYLPLGEDYLKK